jgi:hypothetical protein
MRCTSTIATAILPPRTAGRWAKVRTCSAGAKNGEEFPVDIMLSPLQVDKGLFVLCVVRKLSPSRP